MICNGHLYELGTLSDIDMSALRASFAALPQDEYVEDRLRSRRYSRFLYHADGTLELRRAKDFMQTSDINTALGDVERTYEDIEDHIIEDDAFVAMFKEFRAHTDLNPEAIIEAHQLRWHCQKRVKEPAPEGTHQDGFDFIGVFMVNTEYVDGGEMMLYEAPDDAPVFKKALENGEFVVLNDKKMWHNASPLIPTANPEDGHWDVIVLTANQVA